MAKYIEGTIIQRTNHYRYIKVAGVLRAEHRVVAEHKILNRELMPNERVFHRDCENVADNNPENLVVIKYRTHKFRPLPQTKIIYVPTRARIPA